MGLLSKIWSKIIIIITGKRAGRIKKKWVFDSKSAILNSAVITDIDEDGKKEIIFGTKNGFLYVLSNKGKIKWKASLKIKLNKTRAMFVEETTINSILASPVIGKHKGKKIIVACTASGLVKAYHADGKLFWEFKAKGGIYGTPLFTDINNDGKSEIVFGSRDKFLYALTSAGKLLWKYDAKAKIESAPALYPEKPNLIVFGTNHGFIKAVNKKGKFRWKFKTDGKITAKPAISDLQNNKKLKIIIGSKDKSLYVLNKFGKLDWRYQTHGEILSEVKLADIDQDKDKEIFFGTCDDCIYALAPNSQKIWSYETNFWVAASPIITDIDNDGSIEIIAGSYDKYLYVLEGKGTFSLNYVPGLSIIVNQPGHFTPFITSQPGELIGTQLWKLRLGSIITGIALLEKEKINQKQIIVSTKGGKLISVYHEK